MSWLLCRQGIRNHGIDFLQDKPVFVFHDEGSTRSILILQNANIYQICTQKKKSACNGLTILFADHPICGVIPHDVTCWTLENVATISKV